MFIKTRKFNLWEKNSESVFIDDSFTCLQENVTLGENNMFKTRELKKSPNSSIEYQMSQKREDLLFLDVGSLHIDSTYYIRYMGNKYSDMQSFRIVPQAWMDGVILTKHAKACKKDNKFAQDSIAASLERLNKIIKMPI